MNTANNTASRYLAIAAVLGFTAVALGAFAAHGLKDQLSPAAMAIWQTANHYHMSHALALLAIAILLQQQPHKLIKAAANAIAIGTLIFSGSLYALALSGIQWLGAITPIGGTALLIGWLLLAIAAIKHRASG